MIRVRRFAWIAAAVLLSSPALAETPARPDAPGQSEVKTAPADERAPCANCPVERDSRRAEPPVTISSDGKTVVNPTLMREQADFRLNDALRNVPGVTRR